MASGIVEWKYTGQDKTGSIDFFVDSKTMTHSDVAGTVTVFGITTENIKTLSSRAGLSARPEMFTSYGCTLKAQDQTVVDFGAARSTTH